MRICGLPGRSSDATRSVSWKNQTTWSERGEGNGRCPSPSLRGTPLSGATHTAWSVPEGSLAGFTGTVRSQLPPLSPPRV